MNLDNRQLATVLAALRYWQAGDAARTATGGILDILTDGGNLAPLTHDEIDSLCEKINTSSQDSGAPSPAILLLMKEATEYDLEAFETDGQVNGGDIVQWFGEWRGLAKSALANALDDAQRAAARMLAEAERQGKELAKDRPSLYAALAGVIPTLETYMEDWRSGVADGTYDSGNEMVKAEQAMKAAKAALARAEAAVVATKRPSLAIVVEGGAVEGIYSDNPESLVDVFDGIAVIDYDTDGPDGDDISLIRQTHGSVSNAFVHNESIARAEIDLAQVFADDMGRDAALAIGWHYDRLAERFHHDDGRTSEAETWDELCKTEGIALE